MSLIDYTSHHELSVLQPNNYSKYHICLQILVGTPSATALLQHGIPFLPPSKIVCPFLIYTVSKNCANIFLLCVRKFKSISIKIGRHVLQGTLNKIMQKAPTSPKICASTTFGDLN